MRVPRQSRTRQEAIESAPADFALRAGMITREEHQLCLSGGCSIAGHKLFFGLSHDGPKVVTLYKGRAEMLEMKKLMGVEDDED